MSGTLNNAGNVRGIFFYLCLIHGLHFLVYSQTCLNIGVQKVDVESVNVNTPWPLILILAASSLASRGFAPRGK